MHIFSDLYFASTGDICIVTLKENIDIHITEINVQGGLLQIKS